MPTVTATLKMFDAMTKPIQQITNSMNMMIRSMEQMQTAASRNLTVDRTLIAAKKQLAAAEAEIKRSIDAAKQAQDRFTQSVKQSKSSADSLGSSIKNLAAGLAAAYLTVQGIQSALGSADTYISARARLDLIVDQGQSVDDLQAQIHAAAQRARGDFIAMTDNIARLGILARDAFSSSGEIVAFVETLQKAFTISGAGTQEQAAAMYQLSQAMAAGRLQGDEFRSIMENAPMLADAIAKYLGVTKGELRDLSSEGALTADIIKSALFSAADDINAKFAEMPMTFGAAFQKVKNEAFKAFAPVFQQMNEWLNSEQGVAIMNAITNAIYAASVAASGLLNVLTWIGDVIYNNWSIVEPILYVVAFVLLTAIISAIWSMVTAIWSAAAAWLAMNWPILLIVGAIALVLFILNKMGVTADQVLGFIGGLFGTLYATVYNVIANIWNTIAGFVEFFANVFQHPIYSIKKLFVNLLNTILDIVKAAAEAIDWVFGSNLAGGVTSLQDRMNEWLGEMPEGYKVIERMQTKSVTDAAKKGYEMGANFANGITNALDGFNLDDVNSMLTRSADLRIGNIDKVGKVGKIEDTVNVASEDLKLMRELAEMKSIQNFVTLTPTVQVTTGDIRNDVDVDTIVRRIEESLEREIANSAQGVFA